MRFFEKLVVAYFFWATLYNRRDFVLGLAAFGLNALFVNYM